MKIGIDLNGCLRDTITKIEQTYRKYLMEEKDEEDEFIYDVVVPIDSLNLDHHFKFPDKTALYDFLYTENSLSIFGHAQSTEMSSFNDLNDIYVDLREQHDFYIVSDEIGKSKPASLFFLSKFGCLIERIFFFSNSTINGMWNEIDLLISANPDLLLNHPSNKKVIKFEREYNINIPIEITIKSIKELPEAIKKIQNGETANAKLLH